MEQAEEGGAGFVEALAMLRYRAVMIGWIVGAALAASLILLMALPPRYTATASILLDPMTTSGMRVAGGEYTSSPVDTAKIASVAAVIQSSDFLDRIVAEKHLTDDPEFGGGAQGALAGWLSGSSNANANGAQRLAMAEKALGKAVKVVRDGMTYVINIAVTSRDAARATDLAATIADSYAKNRVEARVISPPRLPDAPSFPKPIFFLGGALALGLLSGAAAAFLLERSANSVTTPDQIERHFKLPVLAPVVMLTFRDLGEGSQRLGIVDYLMKHPFSQFAENMRTLRFGLRHEQNRVCRVVQFASAMPNEGKSTLAACVAVSLAMDGMRTILIHCDLRLACHADAFRAKNARGVAEFLTGAATFEEVLLPTADPSLRIIPPGKVSRTPLDLGASSRLKALVEAASASADFVIIDTPAMEVAVDAALISQVVDATVIVTKWRASDRALVARSIETLRRAGGRVAGIVLNAIDPEVATYYGYWNKAYLRKTRGYYAAAEARGRAAQAARDTV